MLNIFALWFVHNVTDFDFLFDGLGFDGNLVAELFLDLAAFVMIRTGLHT